MKKLIYFIIIVLVFTACTNQDQLFDDYPVKSIYFPFQYPVRTLSLGNDRLDNSLDKQHKFNIGVNVGGYYNENKKNWTVNFEIDNSMVIDYLVNAKGDTLKILPGSYYSLNPGSTVIIPKGSFAGLIEVQLQDAFFQDPEAIKGTYVIPLRIKDTPDDAEIIRGIPSENVVSPNIHIATDWEITPRDYTLFGVKYVNPYHGSWLKRGKLLVKDGLGNPVDTVIYRTQNVEFDIVTELTTTKLNQVSGTLNIGTEKWNLLLDVDNSKNIVVGTGAGSPIHVSGTGKYVENGDTWGGTPENPTPRDVLYLNYSYTRSNGNVCEVSDTLVFRDRGIKMEEARPAIK